MLKPVLRKLAPSKLAQDEAGHTTLGLGSIAAAAGAIILSVGAATGEDVITIVGGVLLGVGILAAGILGHMQVDYPVYERLDKLEGGDGD